MRLFDGQHRQQNGAVLLDVLGRMTSVEVDRAEIVKIPERNPIKAGEGG